MIIDLVLLQKSLFSIYKEVSIWIVKNVCGLIKFDSERYQLLDRIGTVQIERTIILKTLLIIYYTILYYQKKKIPGNHNG